MKQKKKGMAVWRLIAALCICVVFGSLSLHASATEEEWDGTTFTTDFAGSGTEADPYQITSAKDLAGLQYTVNSNWRDDGGNLYAEAHYILMTDLALDERYSGQIGNYSETAFKGSFDGNGHVISGLGAEEYTNENGLFGYLEGTVKNLGLVNGKGAICHFNMGGTIQNCYITVELSSETEGGRICNYNYNGGAIENCYSTTTGGICAGNYEGIIRNCYAHVEVMFGEPGGNDGAICGYNEGTIENCYYTGNFNAVTAVGEETENSVNGCEAISVEELAVLDIDGEGTVWTAGEVKSVAVEDEFKTITITLPSLNGVGSAQTFTDKLYDFGNGGEADFRSYVPITTDEELQAINNALADNYVLMNDIVVEENLDSNGKLLAEPVKTWTPIGGHDWYVPLYFTGIFDGRGHSISGLYIYEYIEDGSLDNATVIPEYEALFEFSTGIIRNVAVVESSFTGMYSAGICGELEKGGVIENCYFYGTLDSYWYSAGICSRVYGTIENCYSLGEMFGAGCGICEVLSGGTLRNCFVFMEMHSPDGGGISRRNDNGTVENCYYSTDLFFGDAIGDVYQEDPEGAKELLIEELVEVDADGNGTVWTAGKVDNIDENGRFKTICYTLPSLTNVGTTYEGVADKYYFIVDEEEGWKVYDAITTAEELQAIDEDMDYNYVLLNDIAVEENLDSNGKLVVNPTKEWMAIGSTDEVAFSGIFDGRGYEISGIWINQPEVQEQGLFRSVSDGAIVNVGLTESHLTGGDMVGGICGSFWDGTIRNCYNEATVEGDGYVGGICGEMLGFGEEEPTTIYGCYNAGDVIAKGNAGGIAGNIIEPHGTALVYNCYNIGKIYTDGTDAGGITASLEGIMQDCYNAGEVCSSGAVDGNGKSYIASICSSNSGYIYNCWYDTDVCDAPAVTFATRDSIAITHEATTAQMTADDALTVMDFDTAVWGKMANDVKKGIGYYPDLLGLNDMPAIKYVASTPTPAPTVTPGATPTPVPTTKPGDVTPAPTTAPGGDVTPAPTLIPDITPAPGGDATPDPDDTILYPEDDAAVEQVQNFATRMYTVVLARTPDEAGINDWTNWLLSHEIDGAGIAYGFIMSDEFVNKNLSDEEFIAVLYSTFFDRAADPEGLVTWTNLLAQGSSRGFVLSGFVNSNEFDGLCESFGIVRGTMREDGTAVNPGIRQFVERCYSTVLGRAGEKGGLDTWTNLIIAGEMSAETVAKTFFDSEEFLNKGTADADYINILYATFLDRVADEAGRTTWTDGLAGGMTRTEVLQGFSQSEEFKTILAGFGL